MPDSSTATVQIAGTNEEVVRRAESLVEGLVDGQLKTHEIMHMELLNDTPFDLSKVSTASLPKECVRETPVGSKVALDLLFPNLERSFGEESKINFPPHESPGSQLGVGRQDPHGRLHVKSIHQRSAAQPLERQRNLSSLLRLAPGPDTAVTRSRKLKSNDVCQDVAKEVSEDWSALGIAESVAAMALGPDVEDELAPIDVAPGRHGRRRPVAPASAPGKTAVVSPSQGFTLPGLGEGLPLLRDVFPVQATPQSQKSNGETQHPLTPPPLVPPHDTVQSEPTCIAAQRHRALVPPPPPSEPPPPPPAEHAAASLAS